MSRGLGDVYKRQISTPATFFKQKTAYEIAQCLVGSEMCIRDRHKHLNQHLLNPVSYTHLRAHETLSDLVCRLLLEKNNLSL
ncbi:hypothetical protein, partial [Staphylococcus aureus]